MRPAAPAPAPERARAPLPMRAPALALALALVAPGCLGAVEPARLGEPALAERQWQQTGETRENRILGLMQIVTLEYAPVQGLGALGAGVTIVSVTDVPFVDEKRFLPRALDEVANEKGVTFTETGTRRLDTAALGSLSGTEYDVRSSAASGKALLVVPPCGDFVAMVAYGATDGGLLGTSTRLYDDALAMAARVEC